MATIGGYKEWSEHGFRFAFDEDGAHFYQAEIRRPAEQIDERTWRVATVSYALIRLLPSDMTPKNFELMCRLQLTNTNPV